MSASGQTVLWTEYDHTCVMVSCCSGAELQLRRGGEIVLRELYPDKSTLYERARELRQDVEKRAGRPAIPR